MGARLPPAGGMIFNFQIPIFKQNTKTKAPKQGKFSKKGACWQRISMLKYTGLSFPKNWFLIFKL